jgi:gamma-glutamyltranspeptidase/glutathione hydrolase
MQQLRDFSLPGRSIVHARGAMAATSHPLATATALRVLAAGGNAVDAGIAACAVLAIAEPHQTGIGGDCFALYAPRASADVIAYNGSGRAPMTATAARLRASGLEAISDRSPHAVTIPGAIEAWHRLATDHGTRPFGELLEPAIDLAEHGMPLHERFLFDLNLRLGKVLDSPELASLFMKGSELPRAGTLYRNPALANTLREIGRNGPDAFYRGKTAKRLAEFLAAKGGLHTEDDFAAHRGAYVTPIKARYGDYEVAQCPPNGQGVIVLLILRILAHLPKDNEGPMGTWRMHSLTEAARLAFACRDAWLGDPEQGAPDWSSVLDDRYTAELAARITAERAIDIVAPADMPEHKDTVYLAIVDRDRNAFSLINSLFDFFGSGFFEPQTGILLHSRGRSFTLTEGHPNALAPGRRPMSTIIPGMLLRDGRAVMPFGVMGGHFQPVGQVQFLTNLIDYGLDLQRAIDLPRCFPQDNAVWCEDSVPDNLRDELRRLGHVLARRPDAIGGAQAIWIDHDTGVLSGASDPRKDGFAAGW